MNVLSSLRRGVLAAVLVLPVIATGAGAAPGDPNVEHVLSSSTVTYHLDVPPDAPENATLTQGGRSASPMLSGAVDTETAAASATSRQTTVVKHGPTAAGYTVRLIRSVANLSGEVTRDVGAPDENVVSAATATSTTDFVVNNTVPYAFNNARSVGTDDQAYDCARASVVLKRGAAVVYRRTLQSPGAGCDTAPANVGTDGGDLTPGNYTLETEVVGETAARGTWTIDMFGSATAALTLGVGRTCRNVLPTAAGATIVGTTGNDTLCGGSGPDIIKGYAGNDLLLGQGNNDLLVGGPGIDTALGHSGADTLYGNDGNDVLTPGGGADKVFGGNDNDTVRACDNTKDVLYGNAGTDRVFRDAIDGISGFETVSVC